MLFFFQLIDHRNGKVLHGDAALAIGFNYKIIRSEPKVAGALARVKIGGWTEGGPIDRRATQNLERTGVR